MRSGDRDPHRTLGVRQDAPEAEIKRAYRALAKRHHPDGTQGSVARFLEIQAAYEALVSDGRPGSPMGQGGQGGTTPRSSTAWTRWTRPTGARSSSPGTATGGNPDAGNPDAGNPDAGNPYAGNPDAGSPNAGRRPAADPARPRRAPGRRRASLGSTSYDDAEEVFEPGWGGASWYGPSSGTYWTLNPREYADPRKHGPEYQARAKRPVADEPPIGPAAAEPGDAATEPPGAAVAEPTPGPSGAQSATQGRPSVAARILRVWRRGTIHP